MRKVLPEVYFDSASTTSIDPEVKKTYLSLLDRFYNSDALYDNGVAVYRMQEDARAKVAELLKVHPAEIIYTSGASEANSMAIKGIAMKEKEKKHIITSVYEHASVYNACVQMERVFGYEVTYLKPGSDGTINPEEVRKALRKDTALVSIMYVNNEIGAVNDIERIGEIVRKESGAYFHSDITQAIGKIDVNLRDVDMASFSAHKIHGLKGSGVLVKKRHVELEPLISGGQQEFGIRGGTSNAPANILMTKTLRLALLHQKENEEHFRKLSNCLRDGLKTLKEVTIHSPENGILQLVNFSTPIKSEVLLNALNLKGIMVSSKSTCGSRENEPSRVLASIGVDDEYAIRVSLDAKNSEEEVRYFIEVLKEMIEKYG